MRVDVGRVNVEVLTPLHRHGYVEAVLRGLRLSLPDAIAGAVGATSAGGVAFVEKMNVTVSAPLSAMSGDDLSEVIARACVEAAEHRTTHVGPGIGVAEEVLRRSTTDDGVRCGSLAEEAAAWLIALVLDDQGPVRRLSPHRDLEHLTSGAALAAVCRWLGDARQVTHAMGPQWSGLFARRCDEQDAATVLDLLDDGRDPVDDTMRLVEQRLREADRVRQQAAGLLVALEGVEAGLPGVVAAVREAVGAANANAAARRESLATGLWLLLPHLAHALGPVDDLVARGIVLAVLEWLGGPMIADDPAMTAFYGDESRQTLLDAVPESVVVRHIAVRALRDFTRTLHYFERSSGAYVLRNVLRGPGTVRLDADGWHATLPASPLHVLLDRTSPYGPLLTPWSEPRLWIERGP